MKFWLDKLEIMRWKLFILNADEFLKTALVVSFSRLGIYLYMCIVVSLVCVCVGGDQSVASGACEVPLMRSSYCYTRVKTIVIEAHLVFVVYA
jgi:hypothetical protein